MPRDFILPDLGEGIHEAQVVKVLVNEGQQIKEDQPLMEVETDKAAVEIPSPFSGLAQRVHVKEGQTVNVGAVLVTFGDGDGEAAAPAKGQAAAPAKAQMAAPAKPPAAPKVDGRAQPAPAPAARKPEPAREQPAAAPAARKTSAPAAPAVRKLARELGLDIDSIQGSGPGGRVTQQDVEAAAEGGQPAPTPSREGRGPAPQSRPQAPAMPTGGTVAPDTWGPTRRVALSQIRKTIAAAMARSVYTIPHVTHGDEADITELDRLRRGYQRKDDPGSKLTLMPFVIKALCTCLKEHPIFNASFDGEANEIIYKEYYNIGIAVDTQRGLIVPNIRSADQMGIIELSGALAVIAEKVRTNQFAIEDLRGGTFTITNVGPIGGTWATPIINHPEVAILGMSRAAERVVVRDGKFEARLILPLNLSFDHRATDGAQAARFCREIIGLLENPARLLL